MKEKFLALKGCLFFFFAALALNCDLFSCVCCALILSVLGGIDEVLLIDCVAMRWCGVNEK